MVGMASETIYPVELMPALQCHVMHQTTSQQACLQGPLCKPHKLVGILCRATIAQPINCGRKPGASMSFWMLGVVKMGVQMSTDRLIC